MSFNEHHLKFLDTLENPGLNVGQQLVRTAGKGNTKTKNYVPPTPALVKKTRTLFANLYAFDAAPSDATFAEVQNSLTDLNMKAVRVEGAPEWIYITPDAEAGTGKWDAISKKTQFNLSWHVGSDSKVAVSDEHNGGDGAFRVVGEIVEQGSNIKLVMSNSRHRATSTGKGGRFIADWAHSKETIAYPIMCDLAREGYAIINVHGMASRNYGLLVNNYGRSFIKGEPSLPTFIGIALAQYFNNPSNKKFAFGGVLPGSVIVNGRKLRLSPANNEKVSRDSLFIRATGVHNSNTIGNAVNAINARMKKRKVWDSGKSCHIEFGIVRDGRPDLRKFIAAINLAAYWMNNYRPELNPWTIIQKDRNFDMMKYGDLYNPDPALVSNLKSVAENESNTSGANIDVSIDADFEGDDHDDPDDLIDYNELAAATVAVKTPAPILPSGGPKPAKANNAKAGNQKPVPRLAPTP